MTSTGISQCVTDQTFAGLLSPKTLERLARMPGQGGTHLWLAQAAGGLKRVLSPDACERFLARCCEALVTHRQVPAREIEAAVAFAYGSAGTENRGPEWPAARPEMIEKALAENDEGDLAEMRNGVLAGCGDLASEQKARAGANVKTVTLTDKTSDGFAQMLNLLLTEEGPFDLVLVDPAFAYLGGDSNSQRDVSHFMRELLNPLVQEHGVGLILAHHTNKPMRGKEKEGWAAGDYAYLGAGSAEWINPARAALAIRSIGSENVFELRAAKRGKRLRWKDSEGLDTTVQHIAHHGAEGVICWRSATAEEVAEIVGDGGPSKGGRPKMYATANAAQAVSANPGLSENKYRSILVEALGCSSSQAKLLLNEAVAKGWLSTALDGGSRRYAITVAGRSIVERTATSRTWVVDMSETLATTGS